MNSRLMDTFQRAAEGLDDLFTSVLDAAEAVRAVNRWPRPATEADRTQLDQTMRYTEELVVSLIGLIAGARKNLRHASDPYEELAKLHTLACEERNRRVREAAGEARPEMADAEGGGA